MLSGQTIKCPRCNANNIVPSQADQAAEPGSGLLDASGVIEALRKRDESSGGSTLGHRVKGANDASSAGAAGAPTDGDANERMDRLYGAYTGKEWVDKKRGRVTLGVVLSVAVVLLGAGVGVWLVMANNSNTPPTTPPPRSTTTTATGGGNEAAPPDALPDAGTGAVAVQPDTPENRLPKPPAVWAAVGPGSFSSTPIEQTAVATTLGPEGKRYDFVIRLKPRSLASSGLDARTQAVLYRAGSPDGPFQVLAHAPVDEIDREAGELILRLSDPDATAAGTNRVYYRIIGLDGRGRRLFDAPPAAAAVTPMPRITGNRLTWSPIVDADDAPPLVVNFAYNAEGWRDVPVAELIAQGPTDAALPASPGRVPMTASVAIPTPVSLTMLGQSDDQAGWRYEPVSLPLPIAGSPAASNTTVRGIIPAVDDAGRMTYRLLPDDQAFENVTAQPENGAVTISFTDPQTGGAQRFKAPAPPRLSGLRAAPFDGQVRLGWDPAALPDGDRIGVMIYRSEPGQARRRIAIVPASTGRYVDQQAQVGVDYTYELELTDAEAPGLAPAVRTVAWVAGAGTVPVTVRMKPPAVVATAAPEAGLRTLTVAWGADELSYPETGPAAIALRNTLTRQLRQGGDVDVIDRVGPRVLDQLIAPLTPGEDDLALRGQPAHVVLRLIDANYPSGSIVELWATDLGSGDTTRITATPANDPDLEGVAAMLGRYLNPLRVEPIAADSGGEPVRIILGPFTPADQMHVYHGAEDIADQVADTLREKFWRLELLHGPTLADAAAMGGLEPERSRGSVLLTGRVWTDPAGDPALMITATDLETARVIGQLTETPYAPRTSPTRVAEWFATLRTPAVGQTVDARHSPLLAAESQLGVIHPVWRQHEEDAADPTRVHSLAASAARLPARMTVTVGLPMPADLASTCEVRMREKGDPLLMHRPWIAPVYPLMFDEWVNAYADYVQEDYQSFYEGIEAVNAALRAKRLNRGDRLVVRGRPHVFGHHAAQRHANLNPMPEALNLRTYLHEGMHREPLIDYRPSLVEQFEQFPWQTSEAWKKVSPRLADPFLKVTAMGSADGKINRPTRLRSVPPLHRYIAAQHAANRGYAQARTIEQSAKDAAQRALAPLLDPLEARLGGSDAANAILIQLYDQDPTIVRMLRDPAFRDRHLFVPKEQAADTLRLLVDRVGPTAWTWDNRGLGTPFDRFRWRSIEEMRHVMQHHPDALSDPLRIQLSKWVAQHDTPQPAHAITQRGADGPEAPAATP